MDISPASGIIDDKRGNIVREKEINKSQAQS
jgi:hypothetical protein